MSLDVALQSVAFYVLSCTTCTKINHRRKARATAKRERAEKAAIETEQPGLYRHPSPFSTNPFWEEEIALGPAPVKKKDRGGSKNNSNRALNTAGQGSSVNSESHISTDAGSSPTMVADDSRLSGEGWNRKRYQREDEELWGRETALGTGQRIRDAFAKAESSVGSTFRMLEGRFTRTSTSAPEENSPYYTTARNPPVNDLHPPVVSTAPRSKDETRWMLQPPPSAKVMEGKERVSRDRSGSGTSSRIGQDGSNLSRQVTGRAVEERLRRGETPTDMESRIPSRQTSSRQKQSTSLMVQNTRQNRSRSHSRGSSDLDFDGTTTPRRRALPSPFSIAADRRISLDSIESADGTALASRPVTRERDVVLRPPLETITSSSIAVPRVLRNNSTRRNLAPPQTQINSGTNSRSPSPTNLLPPARNAMPATIPTAMVEGENSRSRTLRDNRVPTGKEATSNTEQSYSPDIGMFVDGHPKQPTTTNLVKGDPASAIISSSTVTTEESQPVDAKPERHAQVPGIEIHTG